MHRSLYNNNSNSNLYRMVQKYQDTG